MENVIYLKCERAIEVTAPKVYLKDMGSLYCANREMTNKLKCLQVHRFQEDGPKRCVISVLALVEQMETLCPRMHVEIIGETDVLVEWISSKPPRGQWWKVAAVCMISFFGTAFTIMAYHNDIGIRGVFQELYRIFLGREPQGINPLEVSYSIGLAAGIILFFNHIGGKRITDDPTPIEVALKNYEKDVDLTLIEIADRKGEEIDV